MSDALQSEQISAEPRQTMDVDIACAGFGPAMGGFLSTLSRAWTENPSDPAFQSRVTPGMPLQVVCYERADDLAAGVSGLVTRGKAIRTTFPFLNAADIPMACEVHKERLLYLLDPIGASRRSFVLRTADSLLRILGTVAGIEDSALELPWTPGFLHKRDGLLLSIGQFNQWVASRLMGDGLVQIWPGMPVSEPLISRDAVTGLRLSDQGVDKNGAPAEGYMPGMDVRARLTVVGDGPVGAVGQTIDKWRGMPEGHGRREWALGMKFVIELPESPANPYSLNKEELASDRVLNDGNNANVLEPGTVFHTFGYPEPEIFGFMYVHPDRLVSVGIFVPSWMHDPSRTAYRYLQHYIQHPALWRYLKDGTLRSWGAKSLDESGKHGEPFLCGNGYARIGEGSGSTNVLTNSGVDEAWSTGTQLGEATLELMRAGKPFTQENLTATYEARRRASWVETGAHEAEYARCGFQRGLIRGLIGTALAGLTGGALALDSEIPPAHQQIARRRVDAREKLTQQVAAKLAADSGRPLHDALLSARGWPEVAFDGHLLVSHQDALLMGGKVQAMAGFADHVVFRDPRLCATCEEKTCVAMCSGQAITAGAKGLPAFEREKCVHCGGCLWNCPKSLGGERGNVEFHAGAGGLHSAEN